MKKLILLLIGALTTSIFAQVGLKGGSDGLHQQNATSLGQWTLSGGIGGEFSADSWYMVKDGYYIYPNGKRSTLDLISPSISTNVHVAFGVLDFWDIGVVVPLYYDMVYPTHNISSHLDGGGIGDLEMWMKFRVPLSDKNVFSLAALFQATAPTGKKGVGMHPRQVWHINSWGTTDAYTANDWVFIGNLIGTFDFTKKQVPLRWNMNIGFAGALNEGANALTWGTGLNVLPHSYFDLFVEASGETRVEKTRIPREFLDDPMRLTPGVRFHLPAGVDLALGMDIGVNAFRNPSFNYNKDNGYPIVREKNGEILRYETVSTAHYAVSALLTWKMALKNKDSDGDGVFDKFDVCFHTPKGVAVDSVGCPLDSDGDGIPDFLDKCADTPKGLAVDSTGCLLDADGDGVLNVDDQCPNTPEGVSVDATGCPIDTDKDGVPDEKDKCPNTAAGVSVDEFGCPLDTDGDGVTDHLDKCPNTPLNTPVDANGCPSDQDNDGVPDHLDKCPNTPPGTPVDSTGCPPDFDQDGVPNHLDKCPNSKPGDVVDSTGCVMDSDKDGVPDAIDMCPHTLSGVKVDEKGCPINKKQDLSQLNKGINFKTGSKRLTNASYATLDDVVTLLRQIPAANLEVQGHTDKTGKEKTNLELSQERAQTVMDYFVKKGISENRIRAIGYGSERPIADNKTKAGRDTNRRVELIPFE